MKVPANQAHRDRDEAAAPGLRQGAVHGDEFPHPGDAEQAQQDKKQGAPPGHDGRSDEGPEGKGAAEPPGEDAAFGGRGGGGGRGLGHVRMEWLGRIGG